MKILIKKIILLFSYPDHILFFKVKIKNMGLSNLGALKAIKVSMFNRDALLKNFIRPKKEKVSLALFVPDPFKRTMSSIFKSYEKKFLKPASILALCAFVEEKKNYIIENDLNFVSVCKNTGRGKEYLCVHFYVLNNNLNFEISEHDRDDRILFSSCTAGIL